MYLATNFHGKMADTDGCSELPLVDTVATTCQCLTIIFAPTKICQTSCKICTLKVMPSSAHVMLYLSIQWGVYAGNITHQIVSSASCPWHNQDAALDFLMRTCCIRVNIYIYNSMIFYVYSRGCHCLMQSAYIDPMPTFQQVIGCWRSIQANCPLGGCSLQDRNPSKAHE